MEEGPVIKCRFCKWTTPRIWKDKRGRYIDGAERMRRHVEYGHRDQWERMRDWFDSSSKASEPERVQMERMDENY